MAEQLFQIGIKGVIRNAKGEVLLLRARAWGGSPSYWDLPGGRMDPGETFEQTLRRELKEEIGLDYTGQPKHIATALSNLTIPVGDSRVPLVLMAYEVEAPNDLAITLGNDGHEDEYAWFSLVETAKELLVKYPQEFCDQIAALE